MISGFLASSFAATSLEGSDLRNREIAKILGLTGPAASGAEVTPRSVLGFSPVFRAVNLIGNAVAKCRPHIFQRTGDEGEPNPQGRNKRRALEHPSWRRTCRRANALMSSSELWKWVVQCALMRGNGLAYAARDEAGRILDYTPLLPGHSGMIVFDQPVRDDTKIEDFNNVLYFTKVGNQHVPLLPENVVHVRGLSGNGIWGYDIIDVMKETLGLGIAARDCAARFYGQGLLASGVLYMPPGLLNGVPVPKREEAVANFVKRVKSQAAGLSKSHRMLVVEEGAKFEPMTVDPQKAQALEGRELSFREVSNVIGCQPHKIGDTKRTSYASLEQANQEFLDDDVDPWLARLEEALEEVALTEDEKETGSHYIECNRKALLRTNLSARGAYYTQARNGGWMSANDVRRAEGEDGIGPQGDVYLAPLNMVPADQVGATGTAATAVPADEDSPADDDTDAAKAGFFQLANHELERFVERACERAVVKSKRGADFVEFLGGLSTWCLAPAVLTPHLTWIAGRVRDELNPLTEAPYKASELAANVAAAVERLKPQLIEEAKTYLEQNL